MLRRLAKPVASLGLALALLACPTIDPLPACDQDTDCFTGYACDTSSGQCFPACTGNSDCIDSRRCDIPTGQTTGFCRDGDRTGGDPAGGDPGGDSGPNE